LNELRVSPEEVDAEMTALFVPRWREVDQAKDHRLAHLRIHLAECLSVQAAATWTMEHREWDFLAVYFRAIDEICHHFMPFHPPCQEGVPQELAEIYGDVVNSAYRFHDLMLARLIALAGPDAHVILVSDHGFHSDHLRPKSVPGIPAGITVWHRPWGVLAAAGPQIAAGETIYGASLLDITPTVLSLFGLPAGEDMEGKVLMQALRRGSVPVSVDTRPTWDDVPPAGRTAAASPLTQEESAALLEQFAALGYIDPPQENPSGYAATVLSENKWTLARAFLDGSRPQDALPLLEELHAEKTERGDFARMLAHCQLQLGLADEARATLDSLCETYQGHNPPLLLRARIAQQLGDDQAALAFLEKARPTAAAGQPEFWKLLASSRHKLRQWAAAAEAARESLAIRPDDSRAWLLLASACLRQHRAEEAAAAALEALNLEFSLPRAHFILGLAQAHLEEPLRAITALQTALRYAPVFPAAHFYLSRLFQQTGNQLMADFHNAQRRSLLGRREERQARIARLRTESAARARHRAEARIDAAVPPPPEPTTAAESADTSAGEFVIVSGLPRSGTSLMMQMLDRVGVPVMTDGVRAADVSNERGYYEWEAVRQLPQHPEIISQAAGRAVKVISALLPFLPERHGYKIILMRRPLEEIARSQHRMRFGQDAGPDEIETGMLPILRKHLEATRESIRRSSARIECLEIDYPSLVADPAPVIASILRFLGPQHFPDTNVAATAMAAVIAPELHRQRHRPATPGPAQLQPQLQPVSAA
jgi:tetratricopeptide (TPR) repeat protein